MKAIKIKGFNLPEMNPKEKPITITKTKMKRVTNENIYLE